MRIALSELLISKEDGRTTVRVFSAEPTPLEEKNLGRLFALLEIDSQDTVNESILDMITEEVHTHFYRSEHTEVEAAFEYALQKTNVKLNELISQIGDEWLESLHVVVGVQKGNALVFAHLGRMIGLMIHNGRMVDIVQPSHARVSDINPAKVFSNIVSGAIGEHSIVFFGTESILDYISKEKIKRLVTDFEPAAVSDQLRGLLEEDTTNTNFAALVFKADMVTGPIDTTEVAQITSDDILAPTVDAHDSMAALRGQQHNTEELLSASLWPSIKKSLLSIFGQDTPARKPGTRMDNASTTSQRIATPTRQPMPIRGAQGSTAGGTAKMIAMKVFSATKNGLKQLISMIGHGIRGIQDWMRNRKQAQYGTGRNLRTAPTRQASSWIARMIAWFRALTTAQKVFFVVAVVVLLIFAQSVVNKGNTQLTSQQETEYEQTISSIDLKINEGKAAILYDRDKARQAFIDARTMLDAIPKNSDAYKARGSELADVITNQLKVVNNVITLDNPSPVLDFSGLGSGVHVNQMILLGASVYGFDLDTASVYRGNLENQEESTTISDTNGGKHFVGVSKASPGTGVVTFSDQSAAIFNPVSESLETLELNDPTNDKTVVDILLFGIRLYTLDSKNSQIYRHQKTEDTFADGTNWITDTSVSLNDAVSFAIDGDVFVLHSTGSVTKYSAGAHADFTLSTIDPAITSAQRIFTDENTAHLYVLDKTNKRVVEFGKDGKLVAQYQSNAFTNASDMIIDEANKKMYVLSDNKVYQVDIQDQAQ